MLVIGGWLLAGVLTWTAASVLLGVWRPWVTVVLQSATPLVLLVAWPLAAAALLAGEWALGLVALGLVGVHVALVAPARRRAPASPPAGPSLRLLVANLFDENPRVEDVARWVLAQDVDAVLAMEVTPELDAALGRAGAAERLPHRQAAVSGTDRLTLLVSRLPFVHAEVRDAGGKPTPVVSFTLGDEIVTVAAVHPRSPDTPRHLTMWAAHLDGIVALRGSVQGPLVLAGDFNAARWHPPFRRLLRAGLTDAHEAVGRGLTRSWPAHRPLGVVPAFTRLDHALLSPEVAAVTVRDLTCPGSDHRAFVVELAVRATGIPLDTM